MSYENPISAGSVLYTIKGIDNTTSKRAECTVTCDSDLLYCFIFGPSSFSDMNSVSIGFCSLAGENNANKTVTFTWTKTIYNNDDTIDNTVTTTKTASGGANDTSNQSRLAWYKYSTTLRFNLACESPLNLITGFTSYANTTQAQAKTFIQNKYQRETGDDGGLNMWVSNVSHSGNTFVGYNANFDCSIQFNENLYVDFDMFTETTFSQRFVNNAMMLNNIPTSIYYNNPNRTFSWGTADFTQAYLLYNGAVIINNYLKFDVYLDGQTEPTIGVKWSDIKHSNTWSASLTTARMWLYTNGSAFKLTDTTPPYPQALYYMHDNVNVPNTGGSDDNNNQYVATLVTVSKGFTSDKYITSWLSVDSNVWNGVGNLERVLRQGVLGTDEIYLLARFDYELDDGTTAWTDLFVVTIPKHLPDTPQEISVVRVVDSNYQIEWASDLEVHFGETPDDDDRNPIDDSPTDYNPYDPYNPPDPDDFVMGSPTETSGLLTSTYAMTTNRLKSLGNKLWTQSYFDVLKIQSNPIENVVSVKAFPFDISGTEQDVVIGDVSMGVNGKLTSASKKIVIGQTTIRGFYNNFLDLAPFSNLTIFLPYIGFKELDASKLINTVLKVEYAVDFITGACKAILYSDNIPVYEFDGTMGIDVPLTSSDRAQTDLKHLQNIVNGGAQLASKDVLGTVNTALSSAQMQYSSDTTSGGSPSCASYSCRQIYLIYNRPYFDNMSSFNHVYGRASKKQATISNLRGFTQTSADIDLTSIPCLSEERDILRSILSTGFYV